MRSLEANNGAEALGIFAKDRFDLVLTDLRMPFIEGDEQAVRIHCGCLLASQSS